GDVLGRLPSAAPLRKDDPLRCGERPARPARRRYARAGGIAVCAAADVDDLYPYARAAARACRSRVRADRRRQAGGPDRRTVSARASHPGPRRSRGPQDHRQAAADPLAPSAPDYFPETYAGPGTTAARPRVGGIGSAVLP